MLKILLKLAAFGVLFVVLLELIARAEDSIRYDAPFWGHYHLEGIRGTDDRGTVRCTPNSRYKHFILGDHGFRKTPLVESGETQMVWLGASEAFGLYESPGEDIANQLERRLSTSGRSIDVVNASCFGLNLTRLKRIVEDPIASMAPQMLALYPTPHFYLDMTMVHADEPVVDKVSAGGSFVSRVVTKSRDVIKSFLPMVLQDRIREFQAERALGGATEQELWSEPPADRLALFETHMRELIVAAKNTGATVAVVTHANAFNNQQEIDASLLQAWQKFYPLAKDEVLIEFDAQANALIRSLAAEYQVDLIDVAENATGDRADFADFSHFTDTGAAKVAGELETWVLGRR